MSEWSGTLRRQQLGGSTTWTLETNEGPLQLQGAVPAKLEGARVRVRGREAAQQFGFAMTGPIIEVRSVEATP